MKPSLLVWASIACTKTNDKIDIKLFSHNSVENLKSIFLKLLSKMGFPSVSFCLSWQCIKTVTKSIPNNPNAGMNTRNPTPAERLNAKDCNFEVLKR
jgi:hypothetical protein